MLNDAHQAATKDEKWLWTYQKMQMHHIRALIAIQQKAESQRHKGVSSKLEPSAF